MGSTIKLMLGQPTIPPLGNVGPVSSCYLGHCLAFYLHVLPVVCIWDKINSTNPLSTTNKILC